MVSTSHECRTVGARALAPAAVVLILASVLVPARAADDATSTARLDSGLVSARTPWRAERLPGFRFDLGKVPASDGFLRARVVPEFRHQLDEIGTGALPQFPGHPLSEEIYFDAVTTRVHAGFERATGKALKHLMLEETALGRALETLGGGEERHARPGVVSRGAMGLDVGIAHFLPQVTLRPRLGRGTLRVRLDARGVLGIDYRNREHRGPARLRANLDPADGRYAVTCLIGF